MHTAWRLLFRNRAFSVAAILLLAAALALAVALAAIAGAILFRPLPVAHPDRIVRVFTPSPAQPDGRVSYPDFLDLRRATHTLAGIVAQSQVLLAAGAAPARTRLALAVSPDYFDLLGVSVAPGRAFRPEESRDPVVVLAYDFWRSQFAADPRVIGRTLPICGTPFTIVGIAPRGFGLDRFTHEDFYIPAGVYETALLPYTGRPLEERARRSLNLYARLNRGAEIPQAASELAAIFAKVAAQHPLEDHGRRVVVETEFGARTAADRTMPALAALFAALALLIVAIACANLTALFATRAAARATERAVRIAVGASPLHLLRDALTESATVVAVAVLLAIPAAAATARLLAASVTLPTDFHFSIAPQLASAPAAGLLIVAALSALLCGSLPMRKRAAPRSILAAAEIALATLLVASLAFLLRGISAIENRDLGYQPGHILTLAIDPAQLRYTEPRTRAFYDQVLARVRELSGVTSAELAQSVPLGYSSAQRQITIGAETFTLWMNLAGPRYFALLHLPIIAGRAFDDGDSALTPPVAIVNEELARRCGVGCTFRLGAREVRVVGVARTVGYFSVQEPPRPYFYLPFSQNYASRMILHVATAGDPALMAHAVAREISRVDPLLALSDIRPLDDYLHQGALFQARVGVRLLGSVGAIEILLALAGLAAALVRAAATRRREIGIRLALGAPRASILFLLLKQSLAALLSGIAAGLVLTVAALPVLRNLTPQSGSPAAVLAVSAAAVLLAALPALLVPALRAAAADPARELRAR